MINGHMQVIANAVLFECMSVEIRQLVCTFIKQRIRVRGTKLHSLARTAYIPK